MKLIDILKETVGIIYELNVPLPKDAYPLTGPDINDRGNMVEYIYKFINKNKDDMTVLINVNKSQDIIYVVFYKTSDRRRRDKAKYGSETKSGDMIKVLSTVVEAIKRTVKKLGGMNMISQIRIQPSDPRRYNIYKHYVETLFKDLEVSISGDWIHLINKKYQYDKNR